LAKQPVLTAKDAERLLKKAGFAWVRTAGGHRIYMRGNERMVLPWHVGRALHPKIARQVLDTIAEP